MGRRAGREGSSLKRGEVWWAELGPYLPREQTGRRPVVAWQSDELTRVLQSILVVPMTANSDRTNLAGTAMVAASPDKGLPEDSVALAFQMRAIPRAAFDVRVRALTKTELAELKSPRPAALASQPMILFTGATLTDSSSDLTKYTQAPI